MAEDNIDKALPNEPRKEFKYLAKKKFEKR
jgi:hypothetical protein